MFVLYPAHRPGGLHKPVKNMNDPPIAELRALLKARRKAERELRDRLASLQRRVATARAELTATTERYQSSERRQHEAVTAVQTFAARSEHLSEASDATRLELSRMHIISERTMDGTIRNLVRLLDEERSLNETARELLTGHLRTAAAAWSREAAQLMSELDLSSETPESGGNEASAGDTQSSLSEAASPLERTTRKLQMGLQSDLDALTAGTIAKSLELLATRTARAVAADEATASSEALDRTIAAARERLLVAKHQRAVAETTLIEQLDVRQQSYLRSPHLVGTPTLDAMPSPRNILSPLSDRSLARA